MRLLRTGALALAAGLLQTTAAAQGRPTLHVNPRWKQCSFQLDSSLTQGAWHQFTEEAGLVVYFRPLTDARPLGKGNFEVSLLQWATAINDADAAWNDTFVHPDSTHWLFEGDRLGFPGVMVRAGVSSTMDVGAYVTKNFEANYGFYGGQLQHALFQNASRTWAASARVSFVSMFGPEDLNFTVFGIDALASRRIPLSAWAAVSPYAGVATYFSRSHETSAAVSLQDEHVTGVQGMLGTALQLSRARLGAEYGFAKVSSLSFKVGVGW